VKKHFGNADGGAEMILHKGWSYLIKKGKSFYPTDRGNFNFHEIGHSLGLCHVNQQNFSEGAMASAKFSGACIRRFSESELAAINVLFTSGIDIG
jgi:hypothetical protein